METDSLITSSGSQKRRPYHYSNITNGNITLENEGNNSWSERANYCRYLYYSRLRRIIPDGDDGVLLIPSHVIPNEFFYPQFLKQSSDGKQSSIVTIFALWNTMMGTSMLSMPWAMERAGVIPGICLLCLMAAVSFYTGYRILEVFEAHESDVITDFAVLCKRLLGRWAQVIAVLFSVLTLLGASIVYWVLMSNFLYHTVDYVHTAIMDPSTPHGSNESSVYCPSGQDDNLTMVEEDLSDSFHNFWSLHKTVPLFLILILGPLASIRSPTFFTKFNSFGTLSVVYLSIFILVKMTKFGINVNFTDKTSQAYAPLYNPSFPALAGTLSMAFFIHNCIVTIMKNNRNKSKNKRDLGIAYIFVALTYFLLGGCFYIIFPLDKNCIEDNFLNNFRSWDVWAFVARVFLFFQLMTVYPLLVYILRVQLCYSLTKREPTILQTFISNAIIISICVAFAIWFPKIGTIIRFTGAGSGLVYLFFLPISLYIRWQSNMGTLGSWNTLAHLGLLSLGITNFILQFVVSA